MIVRRLWWRFGVRIYACSWRIPNLPSFRSTRPGRIVAILRFPDFQTQTCSALDASRQDAAASPHLL
jgi:hypothetical protein